MQKKPQVLVVDDDPDIVMVCQVNLECDGFRPLTAAGGQEALTQFAAHRPDAVLLDLQMHSPMDGWDVLTFAKSEPSWQDVPVVVMTARVSKQTEAQAWSMGAAGFVIKPFIPATLSQLVGRLLSETRAQRQVRQAGELERVRAELAGDLSRAPRSSPSTQPPPRPATPRPQ